MNITRIYLAKIYVRGNSRTNSNGFGFSFGIGFVKNAMVYHEIDKSCDKYIDLISGETYKTDAWNAHTGEMFINFDEEFISITEVFDLKLKKMEMSKKKILKKLSTTILLNKKEDDK